MEEAWLGVLKVPLSAGEGVVVDVMGLQGGCVQIVLPYLLWIWTPAPMPLMELSILHHSVQPVHKR